MGLIPFEVELIPAFKEVFDTMKARKELTGKSSIESPREWYQIKMAIELGTSLELLHELTGVSFDRLKQIELEELNTYKKAVLDREFTELLISGMEILHESDKQVKNNLKEETAKNASGIMRDYWSRMMDTYKISQGALPGGGTQVNVFFDTETIERAMSEHRRFIEHGSGKEVAGSVCQSVLDASLSLSDS